MQDGTNTPQQPWAPEQPQPRRVRFSRIQRFMIAGGMLSSVLVAGIMGVLVVGAGTTTVLNQVLTTSNAVKDFTTWGGQWTADNNGYRVANAEPMESLSDGNAAASVLQTSYPGSEWRLRVEATASAAPLHDFSVLFDYKDADNYGFVNFSGTTTEFTNGIFRVENGVQTRLSALPSTIEADKKYIIELRRKDDALKVYRDGQYVARADVSPQTATRFGFGTRRGPAVFYRIEVEVKDADAGSVKPDPVVSNQNPIPASPAPTTPAPAPVPVQIPTATGRVVNVSTAAQLKTALLSAQPGDDIRLADGTYKGDSSSLFVANKSGTRERPIKLSGSRNAVLEGYSQGSGYVLHLNNANYWVLDGFTVRFGQKGIMLDYSSNNILNKLAVTEIGNEAIHLRSNSSDNIVSNSIVSKTGLKGNKQYGEGIYIGSAHSNWGKKFGVVTIPSPDRSDRNQVLGNSISATTGESIDIKEQTTGGVIRGNSFNGAGMSGAYSDSWIDVKGNDYLIEGNSGVVVNGTTTGTADGFQTHVEWPGWGRNNVFTKNTVDLQGSGYGFNIQAKENAQTTNSVRCDNVVKNAAKGFANVSCKP